MDRIPEHEAFRGQDADDEAAADSSWGGGSSRQGPDEFAKERIAFQVRDSGAADEPGFDLHGWESAWASIDEDAEGDPDAALSTYAELVERILVANGYAIGDPVARGGEEPEIVVTYLSARETAERAELGDASRAEVELAIEDLRAVFDALVAEFRSA
jgi:hypothetical protein